MELTGKTALVTGAGGDLGSELVRALIAAGAQHVIAFDIDAAKLAALKSPQVSTVCCDISQFETTYPVLKQVYQDHQSVDILINGAGILYSAPLVNLLEKSDDAMQQAAENWQRLIAVNLSSVFYVSQFVAQRMAKARIKGVIVNISSVSAAGNSGQSAYSASKAGVNALTAVWAKELSPLGIRSVAVAPGYIDTPSTRKAVSDTQLEGITSRIPLRKMGEPKSIVDAVLFAIKNDYVNGTVLEIDGGLTL
ncbi:MAG: SDR family NAD(P)-dependent oxidoreductase [Rickettsiales bacterium]|jgi:3-oxoacyl-[acyl-carrier protein] reductase|nr:SDR family NAD(P)-dependent oxidoreductase [Rickettsiales bacterium]